MSGSLSFFTSLWGMFYFLCIQFRNIFLSFLLTVTHLDNIFVFLSRLQTCNNFQAIFSSFMQYVPNYLFTFTRYFVLISPYFFFPFVAFSLFFLSFFTFSFPVFLLLFFYLMLCFHLFFYLSISLHIYTLAHFSFLSVVSR